MGQSAPPCLEHCRLAQQAGQRGVKVILIYPMNALATDQAMRIARPIHTIFEQPYALTRRRRR